MNQQPSTRRVFLRYALFQIPGQVMVLFGIAFAVERGWLGWPWGAGLFAFWVLKDFALFPWLRSAYEPTDHDPRAALRGGKGRARDALDPTGYVEIAGELWRAERAPGAPPIAAGEGVSVLEVRGLTLLVTGVSNDAELGGEEPP